MAKYKFSYIIVRETPYNRGKSVAVVDVSHFNKKGKNMEWDRLDSKYPKSKFTSCLTDTNEEMVTFEEFV